MSRLKKTKAQIRVACARRRRHILASRPIAVTRAPDLMSAHDSRLRETLCRGTCAVGSYSHKLAI